MTRLPLIALAAIASSLAIPDAAAFDRGRHRDGHRGHRHSHHGYFAPRLWVSPVPAYRYAPPPYWSYGPAVVYGPPMYEPAPIIVERVYEPRRIYQAPPPPLERREQRSYAQLAPQPPARPAPRLERYTLSARELFEFDKATLREPQPKLDEIAQAMRRNPEIDDVTITGHTDRLGSESYNQKLSERRAAAVKDYLVGKGVEARRLRAVGKGESQPVVQCSQKSQAELIKCLEPNRRVEVEQITIEQRSR